MHLVSYCFIKWCGDLMAKTWCGTKETKVPKPLPTYTIVEYVYSYIYLVHVCKCIILKWVVDR